MLIERQEHSHRRQPGCLNLCKIAKALMDPALCYLRSQNFALNRVLVIVERNRIECTPGSFFAENHIETHCKEIAKMKLSSRIFFAAVLTAVLSIPAAFAQQSDADLQASVQKALDNSSFKSVQVSVQNGIATLTGSVDLYDAKSRADKKATHVKGIQGVRNEIQVGGEDIPDAQLQDKLVKAVSYDRVGYGTTTYNSISIGVQNGVVTLGGYAYGPVVAASAVGLVENTKGVKDVIDNITVNPPSPMDDRIRRATAAAVYGFPMLQKYSIDPAKPIRIQVAGGHVTLYGVVDTQADKNAAGIRANTVSGVFSVDNELQVANQPSEKK
jgi:osmotically-inducible protein OsmY